MLKIDQITSIHSRGKYARICVEIDLDKPLAPHIIIRGFKLPIEYEGLHMICFSCGKYGHKTNLCSDLLNAKNQIETQRNMETMESQEEQPRNQETKIIEPAKEQIQPEVLSETVETSQHQETFFF
jgi:hypothetical protein